MFCGWYGDLERGLKVFHSKVKLELFSSITVNMYGDFIVKYEDKTWLITHDDEPKVYEIKGDWKNSKRILL